MPGRGWGARDYTQFAQEERPQPPAPGACTQPAAQREMRGGKASAEGAGEEGRSHGLGAESGQTPIGPRVRSRGERMVVGGSVPGLGRQRSDW